MIDSILIEFGNMQVRKVKQGRRNKRKEKLGDGVGQTKSF
jgi:hypothetical protein